MKHINSEFLKSSSNWKDTPPPIKPEVAFIGRSNVGKSSLINMLTGRKSLAKISSKPGKTRLLNHFSINDKWYLVDLPGYGWAKVSKTEQSKWEGMVHDYLFYRENLSIVFVLVDSRLEPQNNDLEMITYLGEKEIPMGIIFTKTDKLGTNKTASNIAKMKRVLKTFWEELPPIFVTSSETGKGRKELLEFIHKRCLV